MSPEAIGLIEFLVKNGAFFVAPAVGVLLLFYVVWRTRSAHIFRRHVWRIVHGKEPVSDEAVRGFINNQTSLMAFRFQAGIRVRTLDHFHRFSAWLKEHDEDALDVATIGPYFDIERFEIKHPLPRRSTYSWYWLGIVVVILGTIISAALISWERGYFKVVSSGLTFSASADEARRLKYFWEDDSPRISTAQCRQGTVIVSGFSAQDADAICQLLLHSHVDELIQHARQAQYATLGGMFALIAYLGLILFSSTHRLHSAWEMKARLERRNVQLALPLEDTAPA